jgi:hypothetical protein
MQRVLLFYWTVPAGKTPCLPNLHLLTRQLTGRWGQEISMRGTRMILCLSMILGVADLSTAASAAPSEASLRQPRPAGSAAAAPVNRLEKARSLSPRARRITRVGRANGRAHMPLSSAPVAALQSPRPVRRTGSQVSAFAAASAQRSHPRGSERLDGAPAVHLDPLPSASRALRGARRHPRPAPALSPVSAPERLRLHAKPAR